MLTHEQGIIVGCITVVAIFIVFHYVMRYNLNDYKIPDTTMLAFKWLSTNNTEAIGLYLYDDGHFLLRYTCGIYNSEAEYVFKTTDEFRAVVEKIHDRFSVCGEFYQFLKRIANKYFPDVRVLPGKDKRYGREFWW